MKILLLKSKIKSARLISEYEGKFVPNGLLIVARALEDAGYQVKVLDFNIRDEGLLRPTLESYQPQIIGIGAMSVNLDKVLEHAEFCKNLMKEAKIIIGGPITSVASEYLLDNEYIDFIIKGEGEERIVKLIGTLKHGSVDDLKDADGIGFRLNGRMIINTQSAFVSPDKIPIPARHLIQMDEYISSFPERFSDIRIDNKPLRGTNITVSRGCPYNCIYCDKSIFGYKWRIRNISSIIEEINSLNRQYGINAIMFDDDMFDLDKNWLKEFCRKLKSDGPKIVWHCNSRANHADLETYRVMYESGCRSIAFGIESGNQQVLNTMRKQLTLKSISEAVYAAKKAQLRVTGYFMIGMIDETKKTILDTIRFAKSLPIDAGGFSLVVPMHGTELYNLAYKRRLIKQGEFGQIDRTDMHINMTEHLTNAQLRKLQKMASWQLFWTRPGRKIPKAAAVILSELFPFFYFVSGGKIVSLVNKVNKIRRQMRIPLP